MILFIFNFQESYLHGFKNRAGPAGHGSEPGRTGRSRFRSDLANWKGKQSNRNWIVWTGDSIGESDKPVGSLWTQHFIFLPHAIGTSMSPRASSSRIVAWSIIPSAAPPVLGTSPRTEKSSQPRQHLVQILSPHPQQQTGKLFPPPRGQRTLPLEVPPIPRKFPLSLSPLQRTLPF